MAKKYIVRYKKRLKKLVEHTVVSKLHIFKILDNYVHDNNFDTFNYQFKLTVDELDRTISMIEDVLKEELFDESIDTLRKGKASLPIDHGALNKIVNEIRSSILRINPATFALATTEEQKNTLEPFEKLDEAILNNSLLT